MTFQGDSGDTLDLRTFQMKADLFSPSNNNSRIPDSETEIGSLEIGKCAHRTHDSLEVGLQIMLRSFVAPTRAAGGDICMYFRHVCYVRDAWCKPVRKN